jgi:arylsulfatase A-like enzyme
VASFTHPHDPYVARRRFWDLYEDCAHFEPQVPAIPFDDQDPHSQRLLKASDHERFDIRPENIRRARRGYFAHVAPDGSRLAAVTDDVLDYLEANGRLKTSDGTILSGEFTNETDVPEGETWRFEITWFTVDRTDQVDGHDVTLAGQIY